MTGFTVRALRWSETEIGRIDLPGETMRITSGFGSGLTRRPGDPPGIVWAVCDRGPNLKPKTLVERYGLDAMAALSSAGAKVMPWLSLGPAIAKLKVGEDSIDLVETMRLVDNRALPVSGLPIPGGEHARHEPAYDLDGSRLPADPDGFEAVALSADEKWLFLAFQSPLAHPDEAAHERARHVRVWRLDAASLEVAAQYLYRLDPPDTFMRDNAEEEIGWSDLKVSEILAIGETDLLVLERASKTTKLYRVTLADDAILGAEHLDIETLPSVEQLSAEGSGDLPELSKTLVFTSDEIPEIAADLEGMVALSSRELLLVNDSDFGVEGATTSFWKITWEEPALGVSAEG